MNQSVPVGSRLPGVRGVNELTFNCPCSMHLTFGLLLLQVIGTKRKLEGPALLIAAALTGEGL